VHVPQLPPHPSFPHTRPVQSGTHSQMPEVLHTYGVVHVPQEVAQSGSGPQSRPVQSGKTAGFESLQSVPPVQASQT
jgi:hypothetical protein